MRDCSSSTRVTTSRSTVRVSSRTRWPRSQCARKRLAVETCDILWACTLDRDELATRRLASLRGNLIAEQWRDAQRSEYAVECLCVDVVASALDPRDLAVARARPLGDFLLRKPKFCAQVNEHFGDPMSAPDLHLGSAIGGAPRASSSSAFPDSLADGTGHSLLHLLNLSDLISPEDLRLAMRDFEPWGR